MTKAEFTSEPEKRWKLFDDPEKDPRSLYHIAYGYGSGTPSLDLEALTSLDDALGTLRREVSQLRTDVTTDKKIEEVVDRLDEITRTIDQASERSEELKADILLPPIEDMTVRLVPSHSLDRLEEYRSDENRAFLLIGAFFGAIMGILSNWATNEEFIITRFSVVLMGLLLVFAVASIAWAFQINHRARRVRDRMLYPGTRPVEKPQLAEKPSSADIEPNG